MQSVKTTQGILLSTALLLLAVTGPVALSSAQGTQYCPGDGTWAACPCGNTNDGGMSGCDWHGTSGLAGAALSAIGSNDLIANDAFLIATNVSGDFAVFFGGNNQPTSTLSDGLRCAGGGMRRLIRPTGVGMTIHALPLPIATLDSGAAPGVTRNYQYWFRTPGGPCGHSANTSNGYSIHWGLGGPYAGMLPIPAGSFDMGDHSGTGYGDEVPVHTVALDAFYMDVYEVTNQKYADYLNTAYSQGRVTVVAGVVIQAGFNSLELCDTKISLSLSRITWNGTIFGVVAGKENHPMTKVTWHGAASYANQLSRDNGLTPCFDETTHNWSCNFTADGYRLPTEAEWEYAARGGEHSPYYMYPWGNGINGSMANYANSGDPFEAGAHPLTTPVGYYDGNQIPAGVDMANGYGLYDMSGNAREWCYDGYGSNYYAVSPPSNPTGPTPGLWRSIRSGSYGNDPWGVRSAVRDYDGIIDRRVDLGFRVVAKQ